MARYFFNIFNGKDIFDETGAELSNESDVRLYMVTIAKKNGLNAKRTRGRIGHWKPAMNVNSSSALLNLA